MSKENETKQVSQKVATKYDLKKQKKAEAKAKEAKEIALWRLVGVLFVIAIIALILFFPIRNYYRTNKTLFAVGGRNISQVEYDYYYNAVVNNYFDSYGTYLAYMGLTINTDFSTVAYSENMTFADYFQQRTVEQIQQNEGLRKQMTAEGFTYDSEPHYKELVEDWTEEADTAGVSLKEFIKANYGQYATKGNIKPVITDAYTIGQYIIKKNNDLKPDDAAVEAYYNENSDDYDSVDYYLTTSTATLPTEPTDLADAEPVYSEDGVYTPSQAEIDAAMAKAKANAEFLQETLESDGAFHEGDLYSSVSTTIAPWLFDDARKEGEEEIIENEAAHMYYVVKFVKRYRSDETTVNARIIITNEDNGAQILSEYEAGGANLDSFIALNDKYSTGTAEGGLYENLDGAQFKGELEEWLFSADRKAGDVNSFYLDGANTYVAYYVSEGDEVWMANARNTMMETILEEYLDNAQNSAEVSDPKGFLVYLKSASAQENTEGTDGE